MIQRWNEKVGKNDLVYHLGDFSFYGKELTKMIFDKLNGQIVLVMGNHDKGRSIKWWKEIGFWKVYDFPIVIESFVILSHEPLYLRNVGPFINIHGHIHSKDTLSEDHYNVSVERTDYYPRTALLIEREFEEKRGLFLLKEENEN